MERERELTTQRAEESEARELWLQQRVRRFDQQLADASGVVSPDMQIPETLDDMQDWAEQNLAGRLILMPKAIRAAKDAKFEDAALVFRALLMMGHQYFDMKTEGGQEKISAFDKELRDLSLENTRTGDETRLREQGDEFLVRYKGRVREIMFASHYI